MLLKSMLTAASAAILILGLGACGSDSDDPAGDGGLNDGGVTKDTTAPTVVIVSPADGEAAVPINRGLTATFSAPMQASTLSAATFTLQGPGTTPISGALSYAGNQSSLVPAVNLAKNTMFQAVITTGATDLAGNALANDFTWSFTTGASEALGPSPVQLGMAGGYVILAKSGIDSVPTSKITGDIG